MNSIVRHSPDFRDVRKLLAAREMPPESFIIFGGDAIGASAQCDQMALQSGEFVQMTTFRSENLGDDDLIIESYVADSANEIRFRIASLARFIATTTVLSEAFSKAAETFYGLVLWPPARGSNAEQPLQGSLRSALMQLKGAAARLSHLAGFDGGSKQREADMAKRLEIANLLCSAVLQQQLN